MLSLRAPMGVRVNDVVLGQRLVCLELGRLWWCDDVEVNGRDGVSEGERGGPEPFELWLAARVAGEAGRVLVLFEGGTLLALQPPEEVFLEWFEAIAAWRPTESATRQLLRQLARRDEEAVREVTRTPQRCVVNRENEMGAREVELMVQLAAENDSRMDLLAMELAQTKAELSTTLYLLKEADADRAVMRKQLENVNSAVRLKAIGLLMQKNPDLANLKLQVDCYQEQLEFLAGENDKLKASATSRVLAKDQTIDSLVGALKRVREDVTRLRRALLTPAAEEKGLSAEALLEQLERVKRSLFFSVGAQLRQAHSFLNSATSGLPLPDLTHLYNECVDLSEAQWREKLAAAFGVSPQAISEPP